MSNVSIPYNYPKKCPCDDPTYTGGANKDSLEQHREAFMKERSRNKKYMWCNTWK